MEEATASVPPSVLPTDRRNDIPEADLPPRKKLCAETPHHTTEVGESSQVRPAKGPRDAETGYGIRDAWVDPNLPVSPLTLTALLELHEQDMTDMYRSLEDAQAGRTRLHQRDARIMNAVNREAIASRQAWEHTMRVVQDIGWGQGDLQQCVSILEGRVSA